MPWNGSKQRDRGAARLPSRWHAAARAFVVLGLVAGLGACHSQGAADHADRYQLTAERRTFRADVPMPEMAPDGESGVVSLPQGFLEDYHRRARSPMRIAVPSDATAEEERAVTMLRTWLEEGGVDTVQTRARTPSGSGGRTVSLSFDAYVAVVPNCGDWSGATGFNPGNTLHSNFACAYNRNIGLMLSDPGDLLTGKAGMRADAARRADVIQKYRVGAPTWSAKPSTEAGSVTGLGQ